MELVENYNCIRLSLKKLIAIKSQRDCSPFTVYQLAKALNMPHSILVKLTHNDPSKRVHNPQIETLIKIVDFFKKEGFNITIDDFLSGLKNNTVAHLDDQALGNFSFSKTVPLYSLETDFKHALGTAQIKLTTDSPHMIGLIADEEIKPMFKAGSLFIVDTQLTPEHDTLVAIKLKGHSKILIRKFYIDGKRKMLKSYDKSILPIELSPTLDYSLIGVVIQVNAKT